MRDRAVGEQPGTMSDSQQCVRGEPQRKNGQRLPRIPNQCERRYDKKSNRKGDVETHAELVFVRRGKSNVGTRGHREEKGCHLRQSQFGHQPIR